MSYGDFTYTPGSNQTVIAECWGAGGKGRIGQSFPNMGPGGGGGAYARKAGISLTSGTPYAVRVGAPGGIADDHESSFKDNSTCMAVPGGNASFGAGGAGGLAASSTGDTKYSGGDGAPFPGLVASPGGGGGSSAGRAANGLVGGITAGGIAPAGGGNGGDGGQIGNSPGGDGTPGYAPGGGGGGGGSAPSQSNPGDGAEGAVVIWADRGVWPPSSGDFIASWGTPPPPPFNPVNPKAVKRAFMM